MTGTVIDRLYPAYVELGRVLDVNISNYTLTVATQQSNMVQSGVSFATPYQHFDNGEGIYFMPEVGSLVWVCRPSTGGHAVVLGWASGLDKTNMRTNKKDLNPGDIYLGTRDENGIWLRRGGVIQIGATPLCQRIYLPINNTIRDFCEQYSMNTVAGDLVWAVEGLENADDGDRPCSTTLTARYRAKDPAPIAQLKMGSHGDSTVLSLTIKASGKKDAADQVTLKIDKDGNVTWVVKKDVVWTVTGKFSVTADDDIEVTSQKKITLKSTDVLKMSGSQASMEADSAATVKGATVTLDGSASISLGANATDGVLKGSALFTWLSTHTHVVIFPGFDTAPPTNPPPVAGLSVLVNAK